MAALADELHSLERVSLLLGNIVTDEQLEESLCRFLTPVLLKLSSPHEEVRMKVMSLLTHINRRVKSRPMIQLPVKALLLQYQDPNVSSFVSNFAIIYIKMGFPRMTKEQQAELVPSILSAIDGKLLPHRDDLLRVIMPVLGQIQVPTDPEKRRALICLPDKPAVSKYLSNFMLDMLLLPYGSRGETAECPVPGLSEYALKRVTGGAAPTAEQLEQTKLGIVNFLGGSFYPENEILLNLIVAAADTRFSVANAADRELKRIVAGLKWDSGELAMPLYKLFLGTAAFGPQAQVAENTKRAPANTRIRLKLMYYLCRVSGQGFVMPTCIRVIFESLYGNNPNVKLKSLALRFTLHLVQRCNLESLVPVAGILVEGMLKLIDEETGELRQSGYTIVGIIGERIPSSVNTDLNILTRFFDALETGHLEGRDSIKDALICMSGAFTLSSENASNIENMNAFLAKYMKSSETSVRYVATHYVSKVFPHYYGPSKFLLLLAAGDKHEEISHEALRALYGQADEIARDGKKYCLPEFPQMVNYIREKMEFQMAKEGSQKIVIGQSSLLFNAVTLEKIISYLRLCLAKSAGINAISRPLEHPCEQTPIVGRFLEKMFNETPKLFNDYLDIIMSFNEAVADISALTAMLEIVGTVPKCMTERHDQQLPRLIKLLDSTDIDIRNLAAQLYGIIVANRCESNDFKGRVENFLSQGKAKEWENQHGSIIALASMLEKSLTIQRAVSDKETLLKWTPYVDTVKALCSILTKPAELLLGAAAYGIGILGKTFALPIPDDGDADGPTKKIVVENLFSIATKTRINQKIREAAILSLGQLCVGENFPHAKMIATKLMEIAKETKDVSMHLSMAETLLFCVHGQSSPEARDVWKCLPSEYSIPNFHDVDNILGFVVDELLKLSRNSHPNSRQAVSIWLLAMVNNNRKSQQIVSKLKEIQNALLDLLSENNEIVQDVASKGLGLVYDTCDEKDRAELLSNLMVHFTRSKQTASEMTQDGDTFKKSESSTTPSSNNFLAYRELCQLALDIDKPEWAYRLIHLAHDNPVWISRKGDTLGFASIVNSTNDEMEKNLSAIVPKLYRYKFEHSSTQPIMTRIWSKIVSSTPTIVREYHDKILENIETDLADNKWRVRMSSCEALNQLLKSGAKIDLAARAPKLFTQLFRVMDDYHEETRQQANETTKILSDLCVRRCTASTEKSDELLLQAILPIFLDIGMTHNVATIRALSLKTIGGFVSSSEITIKPYLANLILGLLITVDLEATKASYVSNVFGGQTEVQEAIDAARLSAAESHYATTTLTKAVQYIDGPIIKELMPKVIELIKSNVDLGTKFAVSHLLTHLCTNFKSELQPFAGKILTALANGLTDRNAAARKLNAVAIGHMIGAAKPSSREKLLNTLNNWYLEKEDDSARQTIGLALQSINKYSNEIIKQHMEIVVPWVFIAIHAEKCPENAKTLKIWTDLWTDIVNDTEYCIRKYSTIISSVLKNGLESASWTTKAQAANAISTFAEKLGSYEIGEEVRRGLLTILTNGLQGRTWKGKERLVRAFATLACNSKEVLKNDAHLMTTILGALEKESQKESVEYRRHAIEGYVKFINALEINRFSQLYNIALPVLTKDDKDDDDDRSQETSFETTERQKNKLELMKTVYTALGEGFPSSHDSKNTQNEYFLKFVELVKEKLPSTTRIVQVPMLTALNLFVDKYVLLKENFDNTSMEEREILKQIFGSLIQILRHFLEIPKYTRIRTEALNMILSLVAKALATKNEQLYADLQVLGKEMLPVLLQDDEPTVRRRVVDIRASLRI